MRPINMKNHNRVKLTVIMPVYNEASTLREIIQKVLEVPVEKELIIVDDYSTDGSREILSEYENNDQIKIAYHDHNQGKGSAIRTGKKYIEGDIVIIQDADLETEPNDYIDLIKPIVNKETKVVYGSRLLKLQKVYDKKYYLGGRLITFFANLLYNQNITDEPTCYKVFDAKLFNSIPLKCKGFEFCPEITAKISKRGIKIKELPMNYYPRSVNEGKKLRPTDGIKALWTLLKYKFVD